MLQIGDIYRISAEALLLSQKVANVYWYVVTNTSGASVSMASLASTFISTVLNVVKELQSVQLVYKTVKLDLINRAPFDFYINSTDFNGSQGGTPLPSSNALSFKLAVSTKATKAGGKRIGGLTEEMVNGNTFVSSVAGAISNAEIALRSGIEVGMIGFPDNYAVLEPIVVRKTTGFGGVPVWEYQQVTGCVANPYVSSQVTRKQKQQ